MTEIANDHKLLASMSRTADGKGAVRVEDVYDTDIDDLWSACTDPSRLARWIGEVKGDLRIGGRVRVRFTSSYEGPGRVDVCEQPTRLSVTLDPGTDDQAVIDVRLTVDGQRTRLVIEERGLPFDDLDGYGAGWQAHIEDLGAYLAGREPGDWRTRWSALCPAYEEQLNAMK